MILLTISGESPFGRFSETTEHQDTFARAFAELDAFQDPDTKCAHCGPVRPLSTIIDVVRVQERAARREVYTR